MGSGQRQRETQFEFGVSGQEQHSFAGNEVLIMALLTKGRSIEGKEEGKEKSK